MVSFGDPPYVDAPWEDKPADLRWFVEVVFRWIGTAGLTGVGLQAVFEVLGK